MMLPESMIADIGIFSVVALIALLAARDDWRSLNIPNQHSVVIGLLFPLAVLSPAHVTFIPGCIAGVMTLLLGIFLYSIKVMGGGDVKIMAALSLHVGLGGWAIFMLTVMLSGGVLALAALYIRRHPERIPISAPPESWLGRMRVEKDTPLPYGLAIVFGGITVFGFQLLKRYLNLDF